MPKTRHYSIEIKDVDNKSALFTAADWTDEEAHASSTGHVAITPARQLPKMSNA